MVVRYVSRVAIQNVHKMSKRKNKQALVEKPKATEEMINSVLELYKPTKLQLFLLKAFKTKLYGNKNRVESIANVLKLSVAEIVELEYKKYL